MNLPKEMIHFRSIKGVQSCLTRYVTFFIGKCKIEIQAKIRNKTKKYIRK